MVETDERRRSVLRFGNGTNGQLLPHGAIVHAEYQIGGGHAGNIGADQLVHVAAAHRRPDRRGRRRSGIRSTSPTAAIPSRPTKCAATRRKRIARGNFAR